MFMTHAAPPNGLDPGDRMPGVTSSVFDEMDGLMSDWSWRPRLRDLNPPVYVYTPYELGLYEVLKDEGYDMGQRQSWSFPAYRGPRPWTGRLGGTR